MSLIKIVYVGKKPYCFDNVAGSGKCWNGKGDVQEVTEAQAKQLLKFPDQWDVANDEDAGIVNTPTTVEIKDEDGQDVQVDQATLTKPLEKMSKAELVALPKAKWGKDLDPTKAKKLLIDAIEELRDTSQLIVITHQKRTMEIADALYGVSMRGDGVSHVVGQRLRDSEPANA